MCGCEREWVHTYVYGASGCRCVDEDVVGVFGIGGWGSVCAVTVVLRVRTYVAVWVCTIACLLNVSLSSSSPWQHKLLSKSAVRT